MNRGYLEDAPNHGGKELNSEQRLGKLLRPMAILEQEQFMSQ